MAQWTTDNNLSSAIVQSVVAQSGKNAVRVNRASGPNSDQRWGVFKPVDATLRYLLVSWDERVIQTNIVGVSHGPLFGVEAYDDTGGATIPSIGAGYVDSTTGDIYYQASGTGNLTPSGASVFFNTWNHFVLQADFTANTYQLLLNGSPIASDGFVDPGITGFSDAPLATIAYPDLIGSNGSASGSAYFDNYTITTASTVPEPGTPAVCTILVAMSVCLGRRRSNVDRVYDRSCEGRIADNQKA